MVLLILCCQCLHLVHLVLMVPADHLVREVLELQESLLVLMVHFVLYFP